MTAETINSMYSSQKGIRWKMEAKRICVGICLIVALVTFSCAHNQAINETALKRAIDDCKVQQCPDDKLGSLENSLGSYYLQAKDFANAEKHFRNAVTYCQKALGIDDPKTAINNDNLAIALAQLGKVEEAIPLHEMACLVFEKQIGSSSRDLGICLTNLGCTFKQKEDAQMAFEMYKKAYQIFSNRLDSKEQMDKLISHMSNLEARSDRLQVSLPGKRWFLIVNEFPALKIELNQTIIPGDERYVLGFNDQVGLGLSVRLEKMPIRTSKECREYFYTGLKNSSQEQQGYRISDSGDFSELEYDINEFKGSTLNQRHFFRFLVFDGVCINIHLSKTDYTPKDKLLFDKILSTVTILNLDK